RGLLLRLGSHREDLAHQIALGWEAEVRLVVYVAFPTGRIARALTDFMPKSRGCRVRLREEVLSGVVDVLREGTADLAISSLEIPGYLRTDLRTVEFVAVAHPELPLHQLRRDLTSQDLEHQLQVVTRDCGRDQPLDVGWLGAEQRWTVSSMATAALFVCRGLGFAWLPRPVIIRELCEGRLKELPLPQGGIHRPRFRLYSNKDKPLGPATQILVESITAFADADPDE